MVLEAPSRHEKSTLHRPERLVVGPDSLAERTAHRREVVGEQGDPLVQLSPERCDRRGRLGDLTLLPPTGDAAQEGQQRAGRRQDDVLCGSLLEQPGTGLERS